MFMSCKLIVSYRSADVAIQAAQLYLPNENGLKIVIIDLFVFQIIYSIKTI